MSDCLSVAAEASTVAVAVFRDAPPCFQRPPFFAKIQRYIGQAEPTCGSAPPHLMPSHLVDHEYICVNSYGFVFEGFWYRAIVCL